MERGECNDKRLLGCEQLNASKSKGTYAVASFHHGAEYPESICKPVTATACYEPLYSATVEKKMQSLTSAKVVVGKLRMNAAA